MTDFWLALEHYQRACALHGDESSEAIKCFRQAIRLAPDNIKEELNSEAQRLGLIPKPSAYSQTNSPLYKIEDIAKHLGVPIDVLQETLNEIEQDVGESVRFEGVVNRVQ